MTRTRILPLLSALLGIVLTGTVLSAVPATAAAVDDYADYDPQSNCAGAAKPGTVYLLRWLVRQYPNTGFTSTLRSCASGGTSEHKDGRALDWGVDAANTVQRAKAYAFLKRIFASDRNGNTDALARRMGIMYVIWDDHIYSSYSGFSKRNYSNNACGGKVKKCSKTTRHRDHVHISLSRSGAAAQSTFYRARGVASEPVLKPGTARLDYDSTAIAKVVVPSDGRSVRTGFKLVRGTTYAIVGDGVRRYGAGTQIEDAACRWSNRTKSWVRSTSTLLVNGTSPWAETCAGGHARRTTYRATATDYLRLRMADTTSRANSGSLTFYIVRPDVRTGEVASRLPASRRAPRPAKSAGPSARRLVNETVDVRARARHGVRANRSMRRGKPYRVIVTGVAHSGPTRFDGNCTKYARRLRAQHTLDLNRPTADHLSVYVQGVRVSLYVPGSKRPCNSRAHRYVGRYKAVVKGRPKVQIWDPYTFADNSGSLRVTLRRL